MGFESILIRLAEKDSAREMSMEGLGAAGETDACTGTFLQKEAKSKLAGRETASPSNWIMEAEMQNSLIKALDSLN